MDKNIEKIINDVKKTWNVNQNHLIQTYKSNKGGGKARQLAGELTESILETIINGINNYLGIKLNSVVGNKDYLNATINHGDNKTTCDNIQVDRHLFLNKKRIGFVENKTYLDACYYDRALADFKKIIFSLKQKKDKNIDNLKFILFSGQNAIDNDKQEFLEVFFQYEMYLLGFKKIETRIFYYLNEKKRKSSTPVYKNKFTIDEKVIKEFIYYLISDFE